MVSGAIMHSATKRRDIMSIKSRTFATALAVMALGAVVSGSAFAQAAGGGGRGGSGGGGGGDGPTTADGKAYSTVPSSRTARFNDPNWDVVEVRRSRDNSKECVMPTEGRHGRKAFTSSCGPL
jgi:hypothetical protein